MILRLKRAEESFPPDLKGSQGISGDLRGSQGETMLSR
jgi:hypothetical protein